MIRVMFRRGRTESEFTSGVPTDRDYLSSRTIHEPVPTFRPGLNCSAIHSAVRSWTKSVTYRRKESFCTNCL
jgi:hypothetical protein